MNYSNNVDILLSTYNGTKFLAEQIDSIIRQTYKSWTLIIRDDSSTDATKDIIKNYLLNNNRIILIEDSFKNIGPCQSFAELIKHSTSDYIMFCDQDDIWLPGKIETMLNYAEMETIKTNIPQLIVSNLKVIDENGKPISDSFWDLQSFSSNKSYLFKDIIAQNKFPGCSMLFNKPLKNICLDIPEKSLMHDWWICLAALAFGKLTRINIPLTLYRQHSSNVVGISKASFMKSLIKIFRKNPITMKNLSNPGKTLGIEQATAFLEKFKNVLSNEQKEYLECITSPSITGCIKNGIHREPLSSDVIFYFGLLIFKQKKLLEINNNA
jgi:glycosyltransferase involved in cell wall biosynthesis